MRTEVITYHGDLEREVWVFFLVDRCIYFDSFSFQTRETKRHRTWQIHTRWERHDSRVTNMAEPLIPDGIIQEVRSRYMEHIKQLPIVGGRQ